MPIAQKLRTKNLLLFVSAIAALLFVLITLLVFSGTTKQTDQNAIITVQTWETNLRNKAMLFITALGNYQFLVPANLLLIFLLIVRKNQKAATLVFLVAITGLGLKFLLKALFERPRPANPIVEGITNFSYPSGHALMSVAFYGLLILLLNEITSNWLVKRVVIFTSVLLIFLIGFSRVYLRVHYPTDVLAGYLLGIIWIGVPVYIFRSHYQGLGLNANR